MKKYTCFVQVCVAIGLGLLAASHALATPVVIVGDATDVWRWPRELQQWRELIANTRTQIARTNQLIQQTDRMIEQNDETIRLMGETSNAVDRFLAPVADVTVPIEKAVELETEKHALDSSKNLFGLGSKAVKTHNTANKVGPTYAAFSRTYNRTESRYAHFAAQGAMYARYRTAAKNEEEVITREWQIQADALAALKRAKTDTDIGAFNAVIAASRQRLELAHQKAAQAKADLDAFRAQLTVEEARKTEATREWSQTVVDEMRAKALAAYQAQLSGGRARARP